MAWAVPQDELRDGLRGTVADQLGIGFPCIRSGSWFRAAIAGPPQIRRISAIFHPTLGVDLDPDSDLQSH